MSTQAAQTFLERMATDVNYRNTMRAELGPSPAPSEVTSLAFREGYSFTEEELTAGLAAVKGAELSDAELESVTGGFNPQPEPPARFNFYKYFRSL